MKKRLFIISPIKINHQKIKSEINSNLDKQTLQSNSKQNNEAKSNSKPDIKTGIWLC